MPVNYTYLIGDTVLLEADEYYIEQYGCDVITGTIVDIVDGGYEVMCDDGSLIFCTSKNFI